MYRERIITKPKARPEKKKIGTHLGEGGGLGLGGGWYFRLLDFDLGISSALYRPMVLSGPMLRSER